MMSRNTYFILTFLGFLWGIFGGYIIADNPYLFLGWIPLSVVSIILTGFYASIINYFYFKKSIVCCKLLVSSFLL